MRVREIYRPLILLFLTIQLFELGSTDDSTTLFKCCPLHNELSFQNNSRIPECVAWNSGELFTTIHLNNLVVKFPDCAQYEILDLRMNLGQKVNILCVDKLTESSNLIGISCKSNSSSVGKKAESVMLPPINSLRKCCPLNRSYDPERQFCWNKMFEPNDRTHKDLIKITIKNRVNFVNMSFGFPNCKQDEVLTDIVVSYKNFEILERDSAVLHASKFGNMLLSYEDYCVDLVDDIFEHVIVRFCQDYHVACKRDNNVCVRKCCPPGQMLNESKFCSDTTEPLSISFHKISPNGRDAVVESGIRPSYLNGSVCKGGKYPLNPAYNEDDKYYFTTEGHVYQPGSKTIYDTNQYCVENVLRRDFHMNGTYVFLCFQEKKEASILDSKFSNVKQIAVFVGSTLSSVFLLLTFFVYACLPSLQNLHGKTVMCHVVTLLLGYVILTLLQLRDIFDYTVLCFSVGYTMLFAFLSSFCWMNVICYDIWSTFGTVRSAFVKKSGIKRRFILYRLYGWGLPAVWTGISAFCQFSSILDNKSILKPDIHKTSCWFDDYGFSRIVYFIAPVSLIIICNTVLFVMTVRYCSKIRSELDSIQTNDYAKTKLSSDTNKLVMNTKLFVAMGINWALEMISLVVRPENRQFFFFSDLINASGGILIFLIFIVKKKTINDLKNRFRNNGTQTFRSTVSSAVCNSLGNSTQNGLNNCS